MLQFAIEDVFFSRKLERASAWTTSSPETVYEWIEFDLGSPSGASNHFQTVLATPGGLRAQPRGPSYVHDRALLLIPAWSWSNLEKLLHDVVALCADATEERVIRNLRRFFRWEYDGQESPTGQMVECELLEISSPSIPNLWAWNPATPAEAVCPIELRIQCGDEQPEAYHAYLATPEALANWPDGVPARIQQSLLVVRGTDFRAIDAALREIVRNCGPSSMGQLRERLARWFDPQAR